MINPSGAHSNRTESLALRTIQQASTNPFVTPDTIAFARLVIESSSCFAEAVHGDAVSQQILVSDKQFIDKRVAQQQRQLLVAGSKMSVGDRTL